MTTNPPTDNHMTQHFLNEVVYLNYLADILKHGRWKNSRPGIKTLSIDDAHLVFDISGNHIPLPSTRPLNPDFFIVENLWFLSGSKDVAFLKKNGVSIWDDWVIPSTAKFEPCENPTGQDLLTWLRCNIPDAYKSWKDYRDGLGIGRPTRENVKEFWFQNDQLRGIARPQLKLVSGEIGNGAYGPMWRQWADLRAIPEKEIGNKKAYLREVGNVGLHGVAQPFKLYGRHVDQFAEAIKLLRNSPDSRRIIVSAWNPTLIEETVLPPCHTLFQFISYDNGPNKPRDLTLKLFQRSQDAPVGGVSNINQYALLAHMVAHITGHVAKKLVLDVGDAHIYENQIALVREQILRTPVAGFAPTVRFEGDIPGRNDIHELRDFNVDNIHIDGYDMTQCKPDIRYPVAV